MMNCQRVDIARCVILPSGVEESVETGMATTIAATASPQRVAARGRPPSAGGAPDGLRISAVFSAVLSAMGSGIGSAMHREIRFV